MNYRKLSLLLQILGLILLSLHLLVFVVAQDDDLFGGREGGGAEEKLLDPNDPSTWTSDNFKDLTPQQIAAQWPITQEQKLWIQDPVQLSAISPNELGDLGGYQASVISSVLNTNYGATVSGDLQGATIINDILSFPDGSTIDLSTGEDVTITNTAGTITLETPTVTVEGGHGVTYSANSLTVDSAAEIHDTTTGRDVVSTNPASYARTESGTTIASADFITVDGSELHSVADVRITNTPSGFLLQATSQDDNNPFHFNSGVSDITTIINKNEVIQAVYTGSETVSFVLPSGAIIEFEGAEGRTTQQTTISIKQIAVGLEVTASNTKFSYRNALLEESVTAKAQTIFRFDENEGIFFLRLGKESTYTYKDALRTFYLYNPAEEYTVFVNKPSHQLALEDNTYNAYLDPASDFFQLQGIITYGIESEPVIQSLQEQNMITINATILSISNPAPICTSPVSITRTSLYEIREECDKQLIKYTAAPNAITEYHALNHPTIAIEEDVLSQSQWYGLFQMRPDDAFCESQHQQYMARVCSV